MKQRVVTVCPGTTTREFRVLGAETGFPAPILPTAWAPRSALRSPSREGSARGISRRTISRAHVGTRPRSPARQGEAVEGTGPGGGASMGGRGR